MGYFDAAIIAKSNHLEHHGIKGQKWGVRRFQDYNGRRIGAGVKAAGTKGKSKKSKHEFTDHSKSDTSARGETWGMFGSSALGLAMSTAANVTLASVGAVSPHGLVAGLLTAVGTVGYGTAAVSGEINNAVANKKEKKFAEERAQNPIDKKTGFHKKTTDMTPEEDMERVNPAYKNWDQNTKNNCFLCTMSMELRRRGYDVQANKATEGYDADTLVKDYFKGAKPKVQPGSFSDEEALDLYYYKGQTPYLSKDRKKQMIDSAISEVESQKDGARGQMTCIWDGTVSGHAFYYANEGGKLVIYDTQANKRYEDKKARKYLEQCSSIAVTRLDNCQLDTKYIKEVAG